ncbi:hypothetical protein MNBD_IGNAVI01-1013 [hydrothermal vent metagenome]|uniref:Uncharacterized protein n=1 Tax=hydrothermal vent metagenome TaxID=652676 RepID=A0A3B1DIA4_9ZZZZ
MKFILLFPFMLLLISCASDSPISPNLYFPSTVTSISGNITNWNEGEIGKIVFWIQYNGLDTVSSAQIDPEGNFNLSELRDLSDSELLNPPYPQYSSSVTYIDNSMVCSDSTARSAIGLFFTYLGENDDVYDQILNKNFEYSLAWSKDKLSYGDYYIDYIFCDKDVRLIGDVETHYTFNASKGEIQDHYNLQLKKGWNKRITQILKHSYYTEGDTTITIAEYNIMNYEPGGSFWDSY